MLGKILLTLAVMGIAYLYIRQRNIAEAATDASTNAGSRSRVAAETRSELSRDLRLGAYLFLLMMTGVGAALYYYRWQDEHTVLQVNLHRENQSEPVSYEVYKYQLQERSFVTVDGILVTIADSERMEILGLDE